jgi:hypothetical protein
LTIRQFANLNGDFYNKIITRAICEEMVVSVTRRLLQRFNRGTSMRRLGWLIAVVFGAAFVFLFVWARERSSATILFRNYNNSESPTVRVLNERHLAGIIDGIVSYNVLLQKNNANKLFCMPSDSVLTVQQAEEIITRASQKVAKPDDVPISLLLIAGLQETFPCS